MVRSILANEKFLKNENIDKFIEEMNEKKNIFKEKYVF